MASCIEACDLAFASYSRGGAALPGVISLNIPERQGEVHVKAGHLHGAPFYAVKVASGFPRNLELGLPASDGMVIVFDSDNGEPAAFLLDGGYLTSVRTGAAGGVAAKYLAPEKVWNVAVIGTGDQARYQLDALAIVRPGFTHVSVWGRHLDRAAVLVAELPNRPGMPEGCVVRGRTLGRRSRARRRRRHHVHRQPVGVGAGGVAQARRARHGRRIGRPRQAGARSRTSPLAPTSWSSTAARSPPRSASCITRSPPD